MCICVYKVVDVNLLDYLLDFTAESELEAQAFRYTRINICMWPIKLDLIWFDLCVP